MPNAAAKIHLREVIDLERVRSLLESVHAVNGDTLALMDRDNNMLVALGFQEACAAFHRKHPATEGRCVEASRRIHEQMFDGPFAMYQCPNGIYDIAFPVVVDGQLVGTFWTGQLFLEEPDWSFFDRQAEEFGFDLEPYRDALRRVPVRSRPQVERSIAFYRNLVDFICEVGLRKLQQDRVNQELRRQIGVAERQGEIIRQQRDSIRELSVPIIEVWDDVLVLPIIGSIEPARSMDVMTRLLEHIVSHQSRCAIIDVTGVRAVDALAVDSIRQIVQAARLLGVVCVLTGLHPETARAFADAGAGLQDVRVLRDLKAGLKTCLRELEVGHGRG